MYSIVVIIVDDMIAASKPASANDELIAGLSRFFIVKDLGVPRFVLGQHIHRYGQHHIAISQELYISKLKKRYGWGRSSPHTPAIKDHQISQDLGDINTATPEREKRYRSKLGALLYCCLTRPDILVCLGDLTKVTKPTKAHEKLLDRCGDYVVTTPDLKQHFRPALNMHGHELTGYADASWDTDPDTSRSRSGHIVEFAKCQVIRKARYQRFVALSTAESEFAAANACSTDVVWLRRVVNDLGFPQTGPTVIFCDNIAAIILANSAVATRVRTKHILRRVRYIRDQVKNKEVKMLKILGTENPADFFTKVLSKRLFLKWRDYFVR